MNHPAPVKHAITVELDAETAAMLEKLGKARGVTVAEFAAEAVRRFVRSDADERAFIQVGIDAADRGELTPQDEVFKNLLHRRQHRDAA